MDTKPLERFATSARRELINAVDAQATAVLVAGSVARSERAEVVKKLEAEIGRHGRRHVVEKVAYTWFNRIIALRFMDARGYTDAGVVSPAQGQAHGQPEILADAKRGNLDVEVVVTTRMADAIVGLLDGTRRSSDAEGEAYALLLTEYCRYWHKSMPFMFEREGDYTELLVPANLLAAGAVLAHAGEVLTKEVCDDVEVIGWLYQFYISERKDEVFAGFKKNKKAGADEIPAATQLFTPHWIVRYLVENTLGRLWMLNRPSSGLVNEMDYYIAPVNQEPDFLKITTPEEIKVIDPACGSGHMLTYAFDLLQAIYEEEGYAPTEIPALILTNNLFGTEIDPRAGALAAFALTMKARAKQRTFFNKAVEPRICVIEPITFNPDELDFLVTRGGDRYAEESFWNQFADADTLGSLIQPAPDLTSRLAHHLEILDAEGDMLKASTIELAQRAVAQAQYLADRYAVVVANPPYMGGANMGAMLGEFAKHTYPAAKADLMTMFMQRAQALLRPQGAWGMINLPSWMFLSTYKDLRRWFLSTSRVSSLLHLGRGVFGSDFGSVAFVADNAPPTPTSVGLYRRLFDEHVQVRPNSAIEARFLDHEHDRYALPQRDLQALPETPIAYWLDTSRVQMLASDTSLSVGASIVAGISTGSNERFFRYWHEVSRDKTRRGDVGGAWAPHHKGGPARRWYGNVAHVLNYTPESIAEMGNLPGFRHDGQASYFFPHIGWSALTSGRPSFRFVSEGHTFGSGSKAILASREELLASLGLLNSSLALELLQAISPTMNFEVGHIGRLPFPSVGLQRAIVPFVEHAVDIARTDWDEFEESMDFLRFPLLELGTGRLSVLAARWRKAQRTRASVLAATEQAIEIVVRREYGVEIEPVRDLVDDVMDASAFDATSRIEIAQLLISYAIGCMFGRFSLDRPGLILADQGATLQDYLVQVPAPSFMPDGDNVIPFVDDGWFEDDVVERFRQFLRTAFGVEYFEENLRFVEESLSVKTLRDYFITKAGKSKFYDEHVQRYKKRPIYWMFSSPKGSFNALIYMHRYTPSTVSTVLNEYLREYRAKLEVAFTNAEQAGAGGASVVDQKEADRLRRVLVELAEYERDVLYPLATQQIAIDLDDGVKANYPKFYPALKKITGLESAE